MAEDLEVSTAAAVAGDPGALHGLATDLGKLANNIATSERTMRAEIRATAPVWHGTAGDAYRRKMNDQLAPYTKLAADSPPALFQSSIVPIVQRACENLAKALESAQPRMAAAVNAARALGATTILEAGMDRGERSRTISLSGDQMLLGMVCYHLVEEEAAEPPAYIGQRSSQHQSYWVRYGSPTHVAKFMQEHRVTAAYFQPIVDQATDAFKTAREARYAFVRAVGGVREELHRNLYSGPTPAEQAEDDAVGKGEKGNWGTYVQRQYSKDKGFTVDPEGRIITYRYGHPYHDGGVFFGKGTHMSDYLANSQDMQYAIAHMLPQVLERAKRNSDGTYTIDYRGNADLLSDGYGTGLELLHGTDATVGDFHIKGVARPLGHGKYEVSATYTWNDIINPNPAADRKDTYGNLAIGGGTSYPMHIEFEQKKKVYDINADLPADPVQPQGRRQ